MTDLTQAQTLLGGTCRPSLAYMVFPSDDTNRASKATHFLQLASCWAPIPSDQGLDFKCITPGQVRFRLAICGGSSHILKTLGDGHSRARGSRSLPTHPPLLSLADVLSSSLFFQVLDARLEAPERLEADLGSCILKDNRLQRILGCEETSLLTPITPLELTASSAPNPL